MKSEFLRKGGESFDNGPASQPTACFMLALRSLSLMCGMEKVLQVETFDSYDVLQRAFLESRDLLTTFRCDDERTKSRIKAWFKDKDKNTWKPEHSVCERFLNTLGADNLQLAKRWGMFSALAHPSFSATRNSAALIGASVNPQKATELVPILDEKRADFLTGLVSLFITTSSEHPGWVLLGCDSKRMLTAEVLRQTAPSVVFPIMRRVESRQ
jgi:hypothetical protein